ncbi:unnamed protein product, partial [Protopolystoma xenopodis]
IDSSFSPDLERSPLSKSDHPFNPNEGVAYFENSSSSSNHLDGLEKQEFRAEDVLRRVPTNVGIPLIDPQTFSFLPIHFAVDPGPGWNWGVDCLTPDKVKEVNSPLDDNDGRVSLLARYLNLAELSLPSSELASSALNSIAIALPSVLPESTVTSSTISSTSSSSTMATGSEGTCTNVSSQQPIQVKSTSSGSCSACDIGRPPVLDSSAFGIDMLPRNATSTNHSAFISVEPQMGVEIFHSQHNDSSCAGTSSRITVAKLNEEVKAAGKLNTGTFARRKSIVASLHQHFSLSRTHKFSKSTDDSLSPPSHTEIDDTSGTGGSL